MANTLARQHGASEGAPGDLGGSTGESLLRSLAGTEALGGHAGPPRAIMDPVAPSQPAPSSSGRSRLRGGAAGPAPSAGPMRSPFAMRAGGAWTIAAPLLMVLLLADAESVRLDGPLTISKQGTCINGMPKAEAASHLVGYVSVCPSSNKTITDVSQVAGYGRWLVPYISRSTRTIFCWIPKNTCSKIKMLLRRIDGYPDWQDFAAAHYQLPFSNQSIMYQDITPADLTEAYSSEQWRRVVLLRDPVERTISAYMDKVVGEGWRPRMVDSPYNVSKAAFELFVDASSNWMNQCHFGPQHHFCGIDRLGLDAYNIVAVYHKATIASTALQILKLIDQVDAYWGWPGRRGASNSAMFEAPTQHASNVASPEQRLLTRRTCERLVQLFRKDYELLPLVPPDCSQFSEE